MPRKLNLSSLKVQSFVTSLNEEEKKKVKGGTYSIVETLCATCDTCPAQTCGIWECWP
ncbi:MAG: pinensin family lanthipeptide [Acidobacteria bacterium]|nr:pinensin family lanthipeptide [Acidobacteriota bacterium]